MQKNVIIVQARMGSQRFPGKMMANLRGEPLIKWVLGRCLASTTANQTVLATSDLDRDDELAELARSMNVTVFRGNEEDVLGRFANAARLVGAHTIIRVCGDRPLVDPAWIDRACHYFHQHQQVDLAFNHIESADMFCPRGFGVEVFSADNLFHMDRHQQDPYHREHVTPYIWQNPDQFVIRRVPGPVVFDSNPRFDVDLPQDLEILESFLAAYLKSSPNAQPMTIPAEEIVSIWRSSIHAQPDQTSK